MRSLCLLLGASLASTPSMVMAAPQVYTVDPAHTYPSFSASHQGLTYWRGKFNKATGRIWLDREQGTGKVDITIDTSSVNFGLPIMDKVAHEDTFFNVAKYPTATYKSDSVTFKDGVPTAVNGQLTLLGVTLPVPLQIESFKCKVNPYAKRNVCGAVARGKVNRVEFGMTRSAEYDPMVELVIDVEAFEGDTASASSSATAGAGSPAVGTAAPGGPPSAKP